MNLGPFRGRAEVVGVFGAAAAGWLLAAAPGAVLAAVLTFGGYRRSWIPGVATTAILAAAAGFTLLEAAPPERPVFFVVERPDAALLGRLAGVALLAWLVVFMVCTPRPHPEDVHPAANRGHGTDGDQDGDVSIVERLRGLDRHLLSGSTWVSLGFIIQAATGLVFWALAAHRIGQRTIGLGSGIFVGIQFINYATTMGLPELLARHRTTSSRDHILNRAIATSLASSAIGSALFLWVVNSDATTVATGSTSSIMAFITLAATSALASIADARLMVHRRWSFVFWRLAIAGAVRIPMVFLVPGDDPVALVFVLAGPIAASAIVSLAVAFALEDRTTTDDGPTDVPGQHFSGRQAARYAGVNWFAHLAIGAPQFVLPIIVQVYVQPELFANFYLAWTIAAVAFILPTTAGRVLLSESAHSDSSLARGTRHAMGLSLISMAIATAGAIVVAGVLPLLYGSDYSETSRILPWVVAGGIPWGFTSIALANARVRADNRATLIMTIGMAVSIIGAAAWLVPGGGIDGAITAWAGGNGLASLLAAALIVRSRRAWSIDSPESSRRSTPIADSVGAAD